MRVVPPPVESVHDALDVAEVIRAAAAEAGVSVTFRRNADGSRQIVEDGEVTSGFVSARGNFCHSASGKPRRGGPVQLARLLPRHQPAGGPALARPRASAQGRR